MRLGAQTLDGRLIHRQSGVKLVLQYTGIPPSWLDKRPSLPSRNWLIFLSVTSSIAGYYIYDRQQCKKIRKEYVAKVQHLSKLPLHSMELPRKVTVYGCKWPADEEYDRSIKYFRKYVKPILVAAAVDYEMVNGKRHGDLADRIANDIKKRRRVEVGIDPPPFNPMNLPQMQPEARRARELEGGIVIVGRPAFKEFMAGLKRGWSDGVEIVDKEERLADILADDGHFDEVDSEPAAALNLGDDEPIPTKSKLAPSSSPMSLFTPPHLKSNTPAPASLHSESSIPSHLNAAPAAIPPHPSILLVSYLNHIGLSQIPNMIWEFFNERPKVRSGAEAAYRLVVGETRPMTAPEPSVFAESSDTIVDPTPAQSHPTDATLLSDLDFDKDAEAWYKPSLVKSFHSEIQKAREAYYAELPKKLDTARALARGTREPTKDEQSYPPPTEVELRAERMKKELRWRSDEAGWDIVKPDAPVAWDERFRNVLHVFVTPSPEREAGFRAQAEEIMSKIQQKEEAEEA
ncbi:hypothetical protein PHLGIDRAFT_27443 [Phlebiopsis gigantea 11061_1 CR5-6]|uniref:Mitochondrial import inner membrane translocase subunit TIM54 n=1 Tax=Phlebiopsis gigantea (strain 11061_1 CR5-6) TaxID=745531 RepID=A0A0C3SFL9_PHLG1|nr:hypothetical protein PHLGIDRAFT_27443 [Phlebiopsis gigantea 11061_1 CR5-6]